MLKAFGGWLRYGRREVFDWLKKFIIGLLVWLTTQGLRLFWRSISPRSGAGKVPHW